MAAKHVRSSAKKLGRKDLRKTKGGILIGLNRPTVQAQYWKTDGLMDITGVGQQRPGF